MYTYLKCINNDKYHFKKQLITLSNCFTFYRKRSPKYRTRFEYRLIPTEVKLAIIPEALKLNNEYKKFFIKEFIPLVKEIAPHSIFKKELCEIQSLTICDIQIIMDVVGYKEPKIGVHYIIPGEKL